MRVAIASPAAFFKAGCTATTDRPSTNQGHAADLQQKPAAWEGGRGPQVNFSSLSAVRDIARLGHQREPFTMDGDWLSGKLTAQVINISKRLVVANLATPELECTGG